MALLRQSCLRKCPHFPFWTGHRSRRPFASAHWSSPSTIFTYNNASDLALLNLDCISLLTMLLCLDENTYKGQVNLVSTQRAAGHQEKTPRNSCRSAQSLWLWSLASRWLPLPGGRRRTCFLRHADNTALVAEWTSHACVSRQQQGTWLNYYRLEWSQQLWEHTLLLSSPRLCLHEKAICYKLIPLCSRWGETWSLSCPEMLPFVSVFCFCQWV